MEVDTGVFPAPWALRDTPSEIIREFGTVGRVPFPGLVKEWLAYPKDVCDDPLKRAIRRGMQSIADFFEKDMLASLGDCDPRMVDRAFAFAIPLVMDGKAAGLHKKYLDSLDVRPWWAVALNNND